MILRTGAVRTIVRDSSWSPEGSAGNAPTLGLGHQLPVLDIRSEAFMYLRMLVRHDSSFATVASATSGRC